MSATVGLIRGLWRRELEVHVQRSSTCIRFHQEYDLEMRNNSKMQQSSTSTRKQPHANSVAVIALNAFATCVICAYFIGQQASRQIILGLPPCSYLFSVDAEGFIFTRLSGMSDPLWQYKVGANHPDKWAVFFDESRSLSVLGLIKFRQHQKIGNMWSLGLRQCVLISLTVVAVIATHRAKLRMFFSKVPA